MSKKICSSCGKEVDESLVFCPDCGSNEFIAAQSEEQPQYQQPAYQQPEPQQYQQPNYQQPQYQQPQYQQPNYQQPQYQQQYGQPVPQYQQNYMARKKTSGFSVASLVLGILGFVVAIPAMLGDFIMLFAGDRDKADFIVEFMKSIEKSLSSSNSINTANDAINAYNGAINAYGGIIIVLAGLALLFGIIGAVKGNKGVAVAGIILSIIALIAAVVFIGQFNYDAMLKTATEIGNRAVRSSW